MGVILWLILGLAVGFFLGAIWASWRSQAIRKDLENLTRENQELKVERARLEAELRAAGDRNQWLNQAKEVLEATFKALAGDALRDNATQFIHQAKEALQGLLEMAKNDIDKNTEEFRNLVNPLKEQLEKLESQVHDFEAKRERTFGSLSEQLAQIAREHQALQQITGRLVQALRSPTARGRWGEVQLRRIVELAGLEKHIDFVEQVGTDRGRPDLIVKLPNGRELAVDAKAPLDAFWNALEANDEDRRRALLEENADKLLAHLRDLGKKSYWEGLSPATDLVVMFVPSEACVSAAFEIRPNLFEESWKQKVIVATPTLLFALLHTVAYVWQQHELAVEAKQFSRDVQNFCNRLGTFLEHFKELGDQLGKVVDAYEKAVGSVRHRLIPIVKRYAERVGKEFPELPDVHHPVPFED